MMMLFHILCAIALVLVCVHLGGFIFSYIELKTAEFKFKKRLLDMANKQWRLDK